MKLSFASLLVSASFITISSVSALNLSVNGSDASQVNVSGSFAADTYLVTPGEMYKYLCHYLEKHLT